MLRYGTGRRLATGAKAIHQPPLAPNVDHGKHLGVNSTLGFKKELGAENEQTG